MSLRDHHFFKGKTNEKPKKNREKKKKDNLVLAMQFLYVLSSSRVPRLNSRTLERCFLSHLSILST